MICETYLVKLSYVSPLMPPSTDNLPRGGQASARKLLLLEECDRKLPVDRFFGMWRAAGLFESVSVSATMAGGGWRSFGWSM